MSPEQLFEPIQLTGHQLNMLVDFTDGEDEAEISLAPFEEAKDAETGEVMPAGLYAWFTDYPDEGRIYLPQSPSTVLPDSNKEI